MTQQAQSDLLRRIERLRRWRYPLIALLALNGLMLVRMQGALGKRTVPSPPGTARQVGAAASSESSGSNATGRANGSNEATRPDVSPALSALPPTRGIKAPPASPTQEQTVTELDTTAKLDTTHGDTTPSPIENTAARSSGDSSRPRHLGLARWYGRAAHSAQQLSRLLAAAPHRDPFAQAAPAESTHTDEFTVERDEPTVETVIRFRNPAENEGEVRFLCGNRVIHLPPGAQIELPANAPVRVVFDRGGDLGSWQGDVRPGDELQFSVDHNGWRLNPANKR